MVLRIIGIAVAIWIVLVVLGAVFKFLLAALIIGAVLVVGAAAYGAIRNRSRGEIR